MTSSTPSTLTVQHFRVDYTYHRSIFERVSTDIDAYSGEDAAARVLRQIALNDGGRVLDVRPLGQPTPVECTFRGGLGAVYPEGPWVFLDWVDLRGPVIVCDFHGEPAHPHVYDSHDLHDTGPVAYTGVCEHFPDPRG